MRPVIKNQLAIFYPQGFLDGESANAIIEPQDIAHLIEKRCEAVLVSMKKIVFFNKKGLSVIVQLLQQIQDKNGAIIGFCDYDEKKYKIIMNMHQNQVDFCLFETDEVAALFAGMPLGKNPDEKRIIVYNEDFDQKNQLVLELYERGYKPFVPKDMDEFLAKKSQFEFFISNSYISASSKHIHAHIKDNVIVYSLNNFVDSSFGEKFDMKYHKNSLRVGFIFFLFNAHNVSSINVHGVNFLSKLSVLGAEYGATIAICGLNDRNITVKLRHELEDAGVLLYPSMKDFFDDEELLSESGGGAVVAKRSEHITKKLVEILPLVTQTAMHTIEVMTQCEIVKKSVKIQPLTLDESQTTLGVAIAFYGDLDGLLIIIFEESIARKACKVLLESVDSPKGELMDALGEFVNIIGGKFVQKMLKRQCKIDITMPRTFEKISEILKHKKDKKGAQVDFTIQGTPMSLFLTR
jgi:CheY-specific phosphatase CheX/anti-anti-sigma regulatory factor